MDVIYVAQSFFTGGSVMLLAPFPAVRNIVVDTMHLPQLEWRQFAICMACTSAGLVYGE